jgi:gamma-tubulin complex component 3
VTKGINLPVSIQSSFVIPTELTEAINGLFWINRELELKLLTDLLFIFQGINGKHIKYDPRSENYVLDPQVKVSMPPPVRDMTLCLCEVGWLFDKISKYTIKVESSEAIGLISQAFAFSLQVSTFLAAVC